MIDFCTIELLLIKPSSDDESGFKHSFGAELSLPLTQSAPAVSHDTTRLCQIIVIAISTLMQLGPYLRSFACISSCPKEEVQD